MQCPCSYSTLSPSLHPVSLSLHRHTGEKKTYLNLGSYNYLGFAENQGPCSDAAVASISQYGVSACSPRAELGTSLSTAGLTRASGACVQQMGQCGLVSWGVHAGTTKLHTELESLVAEFVGKEAALTFGMGFATNSTNMPILVGKVNNSCSQDLLRACLRQSTLVS